MEHIKIKTKLERPEVVSELDRLGVCLIRGEKIKTQKLREILSIVSDDNSYFTNQTIPWETEFQSIS